MPCETSIEGEPPKVWSHWWHSERWAQFAGRDPDDLTTTEIAQLIRLWNGVSLDTPLARAHIHKHIDAGFLYLGTSFHWPSVKVGISADPRERASKLYCRLYARWFVGAAAIPLEQTILAILAPWKDEWLTETVNCEPEPVARLVSDVLDGLPWQHEEPNDYELWTFRRRMEWSRPFWERLLDIGMPTGMAIGFSDFWDHTPTQESAHA